MEQIPSPVNPQDEKEENRLVQSEWTAWIHPNWEIILKTVCISMTVFTLFRCLFLIKYSSLLSNVGFLRGTAAFFHGLRFDLSVTFFFSSLLFLTVLLPGTWNQTARFRFGVRIVFFIFTSLQIMLLFVDLQYYGYVNRHLSSELLMILDDLGTMIKLAFTSYLLPILGYIVFLILLWFLLRFMFKNPLKERMRFFDKKTRFRYYILRPCINIFIFLIIGVLAVRGGIQTKPLRVSHAFTSDRVILGHLSLNGIFTTMKALYKSGTILNVPISYDNAVLTIPPLLEDEHSRFSHPDYPLLREHVEIPNPGILPNVVLIILESWTGNMIGALGNREGLTPNFDRLAEKGVLCSRFFAVGQRSKDAIVSILYSFPTFSTLSVVGKVYEQNNMIGLGNILKTKGYSTAFTCGAKRGSMGFDFITAKAGFDSYTSKEDFDLPESGYDGTWGVYDEHAFLKASKDFSEMPQPFLGSIFTLHPHEPYKLPSEEFRKTEGEHSDYKNALFYSDWALGKFFDKAEKSEYFKNTLFILVADHAEGKVADSMYQSFHIPCLFYFPSRLPPQVISEPSGQLDIIPSILDLLDIQAVHSSFGSSVFGTAQRSALISHGSILGWFRDDHILLHNTDKPVGFYNFLEDPLLDIDIRENSGIIPSLYEKELLSKVKLASVLLEENRIAPLQTTVKTEK